MEKAIPYIQIVLTKNAHARRLWNSSVCHNQRDRKIVINTVNEEVKVYGIEDLISESTQVVKDIWDIIQRKFDENDFDETRFNYTKNYVRLSKVGNNSVISYFRFRKS